MSFPRYPDYKDSHAEWLGRIPAHWTSAPMKYLVCVRSGGTPSRENEAYWDGGVPWASAKDMKSDALSDTEDHVSELALEQGAASLLEVGVVLVVVRGMILARTFPVAITSAPMAINQDLKGLVPGDRLTAAFFAWYLRGTSSESLCRLDEAGHGTKTLRMDAWTSMEVALPPISEQRVIAAFLDHETGKIDALVAEQEKLIELLKEKRQALIDHAVTTFGGVRTKLRYHVDLLSGYAFPSDGFSQDVNDVPLLRGVNVGVGCVRWDEVVYWPENEAASLERYRLDVGDLVFGLDRPWISSGTRVAEIGRNDVPSLLLQRVARLRAVNGLNRTFLKLLLMSRAFFGHFEPELTGVSVPHISSDQILAYRFALPLRADQLGAVEAVTRELAKMQEIAAEAQRAIDLLKEHRSALISAAVTGKIDVRGLVAGEVAA